MNFHLNNKSAFTFCAHKAVPYGKHPAIVQEIIEDNDCQTDFGVKDYVTVVFKLLDLDRVFEYRTPKNEYKLSMYYKLFKKFSDALKMDVITGDEIMRHRYCITISTEELPFRNQGNRTHTVISEIVLDDVIENTDETLDEEDDDYLPLEEDDDDGINV